MESLERIIRENIDNLEEYFEQPFGMVLSIDIYGNVSFISRSTKDGDEVASVACPGNANCDFEGMDIDEYVFNYHSDIVNEMLQNMAVDYGYRLEMLEENSSFLANELYGSDARLNDKIEKCDEIDELSEWLDNDYQPRLVESLSFQDWCWGCYTPEELAEQVVLKIAELWEEELDSSRERW